MFKLGGKPEDLRTHLFAKGFGNRARMILGDCSPQVGMAGPAGPPGSRQEREGNGELRSAVISFSFITPEFFRLEGKWKVAAERMEAEPRTPL